MCIFGVTTYSETKSFKTVQAKFRSKFNFDNYPQKSQIYPWIHNFQDTGTLKSLNKKTEIPNLAEYWQQDILTMRSPKKSPRRRSQELSLSHASLQRILNKDLQLYPYRIQIKHKLTPTDMEFLVSVTSHYPIYELHLFWDNLYAFHFSSVPLSVIKTDDLSFRIDYWQKKVFIYIYIRSPMGVEHSGEGIVGRP